MIFLDVGAHEGQTLEEVTKPVYDFSAIYAFEPMPERFAVLAARFYEHDSHVTLFNFGLSDRTCDAFVYGNNRRLEASIYSAKNDVDRSVVTECRFVAASEFFARCVVDDQAIVKLNCEGAEVPILDSLVDSREIWKVAHVMIDFDIRKVVGREGEEARILAKLEGVGFTSYSLCPDVMVGDTHQDRIANWLAGVEGGQA